MNKVFVSSCMALENKKELSNYASVVEFFTENETYSEIACHVDIFMCFTDDVVVVAPNCPSSCIEILKQDGYQVRIGLQKVGKEYPTTCRYNICFSSSLILGDPSFYDVSVVEVLKNREWVNVRQGYGRCNTLFLNERLFLTSDLPTFQKLKKYACEGVYIPSSLVYLQGFSQGFIGGCCGLSGNKLFFNGSLSSLPLLLEIQIRALSQKAALEVIELGKDKLEDIGGIFFISPKA